MIPIRTFDVIVIPTIVTRDTRIRLGPIGRIIIDSTMMTIPTHERLRDTLVVMMIPMICFISIIIMIMIDMIANIICMIIHDGNVRMMRIRMRMMNWIGLDVFIQYSLLTSFATSHIRLCVVFCSHNGDNDNNE
jgi:hypothetical protein